MDDSNIIYYLILGAIYVISRILKKKKPAEPVNSHPIQEQEQVYTPTNKKRSPVEDLLEELSRTMQVEEDVNPVRPEPATRPVSAKETQPMISASHAQKSLEEITYESEETIQRDKPLYERSKKIKGSDEDNPVKDKVQELLQDEEGVRAAVIMQEILTRKY